MGIFTVHNVEVTLKDCKGDFIAAAKVIDRNYKRGLITETEMNEMMEVLAAKGIATAWGKED